MKQCSKCGQTKPESEFSKNKSRHDGLAHYCKVCARAAHKQWQADNPESYRAAKRHAYWSNPERERERSRSQRTSKPGANAERCKRYSESNPNRRDAVNLVNRKVAAGELPAPKTLTCQKCGKQAQDYHHPSYERQHWLFVVPLCRSCHKLIHTGTLALEVALP